MTAARVDVATLSLLEALDLAIRIEEEAEERYQELAHQLELHRTRDAAAFFRSMASNEARHRTSLAARRAIRYADAPCTLTRAIAWDVEAPDYDEARAFMTPRRAMETALRAEESAHAFFVAALAVIRDPEVRALFEELRDEEVEHRQLVLDRLAALAPEPDFGGDDFGDEPTGQ